KKEIASSRDSTTMPTLSILNNLLLVIVLPPGSMGKVFLVYCHHLLSLDSIPNTVLQFPIQIQMNKMLQHVPGLDYISQIKQLSPYQAPPKIELLPNKIVPNICSHVKMEIYAILFVYMGIGSFVHDKIKYDIML